MKVKSESEVAQSCLTLSDPWTAHGAHQAPPSMGLSRQEYWSGVPLPSPVRSMNQGKLEVVKQEVARVNVDILGISELNGLEWVNLTQMTIISTTAGRNPSEEME